MIIKALQRGRLVARVWGICGQIIRLLLKYYRAYVPSLQKESTNSLVPYLQYIINRDILIYVEYVLGSTAEGSS